MVKTFSEINKSLLFEKVNFSMKKDWINWMYAESGLVGIRAFEYHSSN